MKRASSELITEFLSDVRKGHISGNDDVSGQGGSLRMMCLALDYILYGKNPDAALQIVRQAGQAADPYKTELAWEIHELRAADHKWLVVEIKANEWLVERGQEKISLRRMKQIHKKHRDAIAPVVEWMAWISSCRRY